MKWTFDAWKQTKIVKKIHSALLIFFRVFVPVYSRSFLIDSMVHFRDQDLNSNKNINGISTPNPQDLNSVDENSCDQDPEKCKNPQPKTWKACFSYRNLFCWLSFLDSIFQRKTIFVKHWKLWKKDSFFVILPKNAAKKISVMNQSITFVAIIQCWLQILVVLILSLFIFAK